jgi:predicted nicotinamide N-methyase
MPGYLTKEERIAIAGVDALVVRSLLDQQQFADDDGAAARLGISSAAWPMFGMLWPSGAMLAALLGARPVTAGERILEVGCGLALASLVSHRRGADVTASDRHPLAAEFLADNLRLNRLPPMKYMHADWSAAASPASANAVDGFDLVVGSDLLYERDAAGDLARFICGQAKASAEVWIVDPDRGNRPAFNRRMADAGFIRREERLDTPATADAPAYKGRLLVYRRKLPGH